MIFADLVLSSLLNLQEPSIYTKPEPKQEKVKFPRQVETAPPPKAMPPPEVAAPTAATAPPRPIAAPQEVAQEKEMPKVKPETMAPQVEAVKKPLEVQTRGNIVSSKPSCVLHVSSLRSSWTSSGLRL